MKLRHAPLLLVREMARHATHRALVAETLARVIQRADELAEFVAIYWAGRTRAAVGAGEEGPGRGLHQVRRVCAGQVRSRRRRSPARRAVPLPRQAASTRRRPRSGSGSSPASSPPPTPGRLRSPPGIRRRQARRMERLLAERKLGALALLRNLRNMKDADVDEAARRSTRSMP